MAPIHEKDIAGASRARFLSKDIGANDILCRDPSRLR